MAGMFNILLVYASQVGGLPAATIGYYGGGMTPGITSKITSVRFSDEVVANLAAGLVLARMNASGLSSQTKGYFLGGRYYVHPNWYEAVEIDGLRFADGASVNPAASLPNTSSSTASGGSVTAGYVAGYIVGGQYLRMVKLAYSDETVSVCASQLSTQSGGDVGIASSTTLFLAGGSDSMGNETNRFAAFSLSTETEVGVSGALAVARSGPTGLFSATAGYVISGSRIADEYEANITSVEKINFGTETISLTSANILIGRGNAPGTSGASKGVISDGSPGIGGNAPTEVFSFSTETAYQMATQINGYAGTGVQG